ncbi:STAS domain-containing protein [Actinoplanes sp. NPDC049316]|uniref:STAS domain-containing protein n=1 Tax=Actinoplanes sp. NPDC049316 TaxID=3154727 RepID=UPI00341E2A3E
MERPTEEAAGVHEHYTILREPEVMSLGGTATLVVHAGGDIDLQACPTLRGVILDAVADARAEAVTVDLTRATFIDSAALQALLHGFLAASEAHKGFHVANAHGIVEQVLVTTGMLEVFNGRR